VNSRDVSQNPANFPPGTAACPICHATECAAWARGYDRLFERARGFFDLYRCAGCGCIFQHPMPDPSTMSELYPPQYWWSGNPRAGRAAERLLGRLETAYREFVLRDHVRFLKCCARRNGGGDKLLLDIGCGSGTFLHLAGLQGFVPHGMDTSARAVEVASKQYGYPVRHGAIGSPVWEDCRFDFITMFHVLEHLPDPAQGLQYAADLLKPAGTLILQVPNVRSIQARLFGRRWYGLDVPRHTINYSPGALGLLLRESGLDFRLVPQFSLRDNPASIASSLLPWLDPIGRKGRKPELSPILSGAAEIAYLGAFLLALPPALVESALGCGGTIWAYARRSRGRA